MVFPVHLQFVEINPKKRFAQAGLDGQPYRMNRIVMPGIANEQAQGKALLLSDAAACQPVIMSWSLVH